MGDVQLIIYGLLRFSRVFDSEVHRDGCLSRNVWHNLIQLRFFQYRSEMQIAVRALNYDHDFSFVFHRITSQSEVAKNQSKYTLAQQSTSAVSDSIRLPIEFLLEPLVVSFFQDTVIALHL